jgi:putative SOS response-associated peptidase YedK
MCGRFTRHYSWQELYDLYRLTLRSSHSNLPPRYNICPTTDIDAVIPHFDQRELVSMRWGFIPHWWNKPLKDMRMVTFNARAEGIAEKPMFRDAFKRSRCLIPASGYYEWVTTEGGTKQPFYFTRRDGQVMTFAGLYDVWKNPETGNAVRSCTMVVCPPNAFAARFHDRMPVILETDDFMAWERGHAREAAPLMKAAGEDVLQARPVSMRVNSSSADEHDATLIAQAELSAVSRH